VLDCPYAQCIRPLLRGPELWSGHCRESSAPAHGDQPGVVPAESAAPVDQMGTAQQHQYSAVGVALRAAPGGAEQGAVPRELLDEEQTIRREGQSRTGVRMAGTRGAARKGRSRRFRTL